VLQFALKRVFDLILCVLMRLSILLCCLVSTAFAGALPYATPGWTVHGEWRAETEISPPDWKPGDEVEIRTTLYFSRYLLASLELAGIRPDTVLALATAERTFDPEGRMRWANDERFSTVLTPTGLPIEGGVQGAVTKRFGYGFETPFDQFATLWLTSVRESAGSYAAEFRMVQRLPAGLPPGVYRMRIDYGFRVGTRNYSLGGESFAVRSSATPQVNESYHYSPLIRASGRHALGHDVAGAEIRPRVPWVLLNGYNSNGYRGVVAEEDQSWFGISGRNLIQDDVILPLFDANSRNIPYTLEPQVVPDQNEDRIIIPWAPDKGQLTIDVTTPDGKTTRLGTAPFVALSGRWPTTRNTAFTAWRPTAYGLHIVKATGWWEDAQGNRYEGGGTYRFWIAKRMTLATATFQGMSYPVGNFYGRALGFAPAFPAKVEVVARLYPFSNPEAVKELRYEGQATAGGIFTGAEGMKTLVFDQPGEYWAYVLARHQDENGHHWVCSMRHAGVVYPEDTTIEARGKMLYLGGKYVPRGETLKEGLITEAGEQKLDHINFPYRNGDVLLIASEGQGANKIEPTLMWEPRNATTYDTRFQGIGKTNLQLVTSNGYSPHLFPEYITEWGYYYAAAPRPGFMGRFLVAENNSRAPYWPLSPNSFGGQINASVNGDLPGDIYRLIGGVVLRRPGATPLYAGYLASAFMLERGTNNNRIVAAGSEDVPGPYRQRARFFLVGPRPGMVYTVGTTFAAAAQIDPVLPASVTVTLTYPDGRVVTTTGQGDRFGSFAARDRWVLDQPGVYRYTMTGEWEGFQGGVPGLPKEGGELFVLEANRPANATELTLDIPEDANMDPVAGIRITGRSTAQRVYVAAVIPGAVIDQRWLEVSGGRFAYTLNPKELESRTPTYDTAHRVTGVPSIGDVIHLTFFSREEGQNGAWHGYRRVIVRGTKLLNIK
jgi:hypothetical protein